MLPFKDYLNEINNNDTKSDKINFDILNIFNETSEDEITEWYHGTPHKITSFSTEFVGQGTDQEGPGIYFTSNEEDAAGYAMWRKGSESHIYKVQLNFRKTVPLKGRLPMKELEKMILWAEDYETKLMNWGSESLEENMKLFKQTLMREDGPHQAFLSVYVNLYRYNPQEFCSNMVTLGYDGVVVPRGFMNTKHAIVYNPKIIRVIEEY